MDDPGRGDKDAKERSFSLTISVSCISCFFGECSSAPGVRFRNCFGEGGGGIETELGIRTRTVD